MFRETKSSQSCAQKIPNTIISLDKMGILKIWQENLYATSLQFYPLHSYALIKPQESLLGQVSFCNIQLQRSEQFLFSDGLNVPTSSSKFKDSKFGSYELSPYISMDYIAVLKQNQCFEIYSISHLRNQSQNSNFELVKCENEPTIVSNMKKILFCKNILINDCEYLEMVGTDIYGNLLKASLNINNPSNVKLMFTNKYQYGQIKFF